MPRRWLVRQIQSTGTAVLSLTLSWLSGFGSKERHVVSGAPALFSLTVCLGIMIPVIGTLMSFLGIALAFFFVYPCWMWSRNEGLARVLSRLREAGQLGCLRLHRWLGAQGAGGLPQLGPADGQHDGAMVVALPQCCLHHRYSMRGSNQFQTKKRVPTAAIGGRFR